MSVTMTHIIHIIICITFFLHKVLSYDIHVPLNISTDNLLTTTNHQTSPCSRTDTICWSIKARQYSNIVRRRHGQNKMLSDGPQTQLLNADQYARHLASIRTLRHQQLSQATNQVGCNRFIAGENIAYNYEQGDVAKACVDQWENSPGHLANLLRSKFDEVVVGFYFSSDNRVYCVQTFAIVVKNELSSTRCRKLSQAENNVVVQRPRPSPRHNSPSTQQPPPTSSRPRPTRPTSQTRPSRRQRHRLSSRDRHAGSRACRCLQVGNRCWYSLKGLSGNRCMPYTLAINQPLSCKRLCCHYCTHFPSHNSCRSAFVRVICSSLY